MNNDWLDIDVLEDYLDGKLDAKAMHFVERQALEDPFVAEALEGLKQSPKRKQTLSILQKQLHDRVSQKPVKRKLWGITTHRLSIAATATVAFIAVSILFFMRETTRRNNEVASRNASGVMVNLDSNTTIASVEPKKDVAEDVAKTTLIDKAIVEAKTGALAKNTKSAPVLRNAEREAASEILSDNMAPSKAKAESFSERKAVAEEAVVASAPVLSGSSLVYSGNVVTQNGQPVK